MRMIFSFWVCAGEEIAAVPLADIVKRICGLSDPLGQKLKERVERCFEKTASMIQDAGFAPQAIRNRFWTLVLYPNLAQ